MTLYVDLTGYYQAVGGDIGNIVEGDGGIGSGSGTEPIGYGQVTYSQTQSGFGEDLINALVNTFSNDIIILGVDNTYMLSDNTPITNNQGICFPPDSNGVIKIIYDTTQCGGNGYYVYDNGGNPICMPGYIILGHECSHAYHYANGDTAANPEIQAETDENQVRAQHGLPLRKVDNHFGGCGSCSGGIGQINFNCIIASAAFGSPRAPQVNKLRELRDIFLSQSSLGDEFFGNLYSEYYRFSPQIAWDMDTLPSLKVLISKLAVEPLLDFFTLLELYVRGGWQQEQQENFENQAKRVLMRSIKKLPEAGLRHDQIESIYLTITRMKARLNGKRDAGWTQKAPSTPSACTDPELILDYLASTAEASAPSTEYVSWAIMEPLAFYWSALSRFESQQKQSSNLGSYFAEAIDNWLSSVPIPSTFDQFSEETVRNDLAQLTEIIFTIPSVRKKFGTRLIENYASQVSYDLRTVLQEVDYIPFTGKIKES